MSPHSIKKISSHAFTETMKPYFVNATEWSHCGNGIVEQGEECDEGEAEMCCSKCRIKPNAQCSPYNSLCCDQKCHFQTSGPCMPWNYCPDKSHFCENTQVYCRPDKINVKCDHEDSFSGSVNSKIDRKFLSIPQANDSKDLKKANDNQSKEKSQAISDFVVTVMIVITCKLT